MKKILSIASLSLLFFACSDDSSSTSPTNEVPESSSAAIENTDTPSSETVAPESSADVSVPGSSSTIAINLNIDYKVDPVSSASAYSCTTTPLTFGTGVDVTCDEAYLGSIMENPDTAPYDPNQTYVDFIGLEKVYAALQPGDKMAIVIRHAARTSSTDQGGILTGLGELQAISVGSKLISETEPYYYHSEILRTEQTCHKIAQGRGQTEIKHATLTELNGGWFVKDQETYAVLEEEAITVYDLIADYAYNGKYLEAHYELATRAQQLIDEVIIGKMIVSNPISIAVSHDQLVMPLLVHATQGQIDLRYFENQNWLNFLAGLAVIVSQDGSVKYIPVKGLDRGVL